MFTDNVWNPWHGCRKYSAGCAHCYVYRRDDSVGRDASAVELNRDFDRPVRRGRDGEYKIPAGAYIYSCMTSDFFLDLADEWRPRAWGMIRERFDVHFTIITKRVLRIADCLPPDWGSGWENVSICATMENQEEFDRRFPVFLDLPIRHKSLACEPLLTPIDTRGALRGSSIELLVAGGESGPGARVCDYDWVLSLRSQCVEAGVPFYFKQTGANFRKDGRVYAVRRKFQHSQARKAGISTAPYYTVSGHS